MNFFKDKFGRARKAGGGFGEGGRGGATGAVQQYPTLSHSQSAYYLPSTRLQPPDPRTAPARPRPPGPPRPLPTSLSTGSFTPFQSGSSEPRTFPRSSTTQSFQNVGGFGGQKHRNGSLPSSSQSSDESEDCGGGGRGLASSSKRRAGCRSSSLPRHRASKTNTLDTQDCPAQDLRQQQQQHGSHQLNSWLQSLQDVPDGGPGSSKTEILRITRGRLKDGGELQAGQETGGKRKWNSSRENSLESLLEEEPEETELAALQVHHCYIPVQTTAVRHEQNLEGAIRNLFSWRWFSLPLF